MLGLAGVVLLVLAFVVRPAYQRLLSWRAETVVRQAEELIGQQHWPEALEKLDAALKIQPASTPALRALGGVYSRFELPSALPIYRALLNSPGHTAEDLHAYLEIALRLQRFDLVEGELSTLLNRTNVTLQTRIQAVEFYFRQGDFGRALSFAEEIRRLQPTNNLNHLRVAKILLFRGIPTEQIDALNILADVRNPSPLERINMLEMLSNAPTVPKRPALRFLDQTPPGSQATPVEFFLEAETRLRLAPDSRSNLVAQAIDRFAKGSPEQQADLCGWLARAGETTRVFELWRTEQAAQHPILFANYLEALTRAQRWTNLQAAVSTNAPIEAWQLEAYRATAAARLKQDQLADELWRRAFEQTAKHPVKLRGLGDYASRLGFTSQAIEAYESITKDRLHRASAFRRLAGIFERTRQTDRLRVNAQAWSASIPDDPQPELAFCYLSALLGLDTDLAHARATKLLQRQPSRLAYRTAVAYLEFRRNKPQDALAMLDRIRFDNPNIPAQTRLVYAILLEANGLPSRAKEMVEDVKPDALLPEEQENLRRIKAL